MGILVLLAAIILMQPDSYMLLQTALLVAEVLLGCVAIMLAVIAFAGCAQLKKQRGFNEFAEKFGVSRAAIAARLEIFEYSSYTTC